MSERRGGVWSWFSRTKDALTAPELVERLQKVERALELEYVHKPQAEVTGASGTAAAQLIAALDRTPQAAIQIGTILLIKVTPIDGEPTIFVRTLSQNEMIALERQPELLSNPADILRLLRDATALNPASSPHD